jgi:hypothetical protein
MGYVKRTWQDQFPGDSTSALNFNDWEGRIDAGIAATLNPRSESYGFWPNDEPPTSAQAVTANWLYYRRFIAKRAITATGLAFAVTVAASVNDSMDAGILDISGNRLASTGATAGLMNSLGAKSPSFTAPVLLVAGVAYWAVLVSAVGGTAAQISAYNMGSGLVPTLSCAVPGTLDAFATAGSRNNASAVIGTTPGLPNSTTQSFGPGVFVRGT